MKKIIAIIVMLIFISILTFGCNNENGLSSEDKDGKNFAKNENEVVNADSIQCSVIEDPITFIDKNFDGRWGVRMKFSENLKYIYCLQKGDTLQWKSYFLNGRSFAEETIPWGRKIKFDIKDGLMNIVNIVEDSNERNTYICTLLDGEYYLYRHTKGEANIQKDKIEKILNLSQDQIIDDMVITPEDNLVFFISKKISNDEIEHSSMALYNPMTNEILISQKYMLSRSVCFGENREIYYLNEGENCIIGKEFGSDSIQSVIPLNDLCQLDWNSKLVVKDGRGAIYTESGIVTGMMTGKDWHKVIDSNQYYKERQDYYITDFVMVSGKDSEYYVFTILEDNETMKWVHYY